VAEAVTPEPLWRRPALHLVLVFLGVVLLLFLFVFPTRTFLSQRRETSSVRDQLHMLRQQNANLQREEQRLQSSDEIERIARDQYNLVKPGEKAYAIIPEYTPATTAPASSGVSGSTAAVLNAADANDAPVGVPTTSSSGTPLPGAPSP